MSLPRREQTWERLREPWDVLIVGGGITGVGILLEAARRGLRAVLVERGDYACGASSRSSKLVHGGLRYLKEGRLALTRESVREREALLRVAPGLVERLPFMLPHYRGQRPGAASVAAGLALYDLLAGRRTRRRLDARQTLELVPEIERQGLLGAHGYGDAWTDDARLVLRLLHAAVDAGGAALNYVCVDEILRLGGRAAGAALRDVLSGARSEVQARTVVNAAGPAADRLRTGSGVTPKLRPLRGSHLLLPNWRLPLAQAVAFFHPHDRRPIFAYPWLGAVLAGTTDLDHCEDPAVEAAISSQEAAYLIAGLRFQFPRLDLTLHDASAAFAGVRPVLLGGHAEPSRESRDHLILREQGLVTAIGGKLTTFRPLALAALRAACAEAGMRASFEPRPVFSPAAQPVAPALAPAMRRRLAGRYGRWAQDVVDAARGDEFDPVGASEFLWCELRWAARAESVEHLDDLLLRRTRVGLLTPEGGARYLPRVREICASELGWDDARWQREATEYRMRWRRAYAAEHGDAV